jgi:Ca2+-dependent lipid-binding protein
VVQIARSPVVFRTKVIKDTKTPVWDESTEFGVTNPLFDILHILVRDKDRISDDDIGVLDVPLARFGDLMPNEAWYTLTPCQRGKMGGHIKLKLQLAIAPPQEIEERNPGIWHKPPKT